MTDHPLTDEICREVADSMIDFPNGFPDAHDHMRAGTDWQLERVIEWLNFGYQSDPNLSRERKHRGGFHEIAIALEKAMRPQQQEDN